MSDWDSFFTKARQAGVSAERAAQLADEEFPRDKSFPGSSSVPKAVPWSNPVSRLPPMQAPVPKPRKPRGFDISPGAVNQAPVPEDVGEWDMKDVDGVPSWVRRRQVQAANALDFQPPKRDKALPLDPDQIDDALNEHFTLIETRELDGLDVWFVLALKSGTLDKYEIIMYEYRGEWVCSSITKLLSDWYDNGASE